MTFLYIKKMFRLKTVLMLMGCGLAALPSNAQLKLGGSPEAARGDAVLELGSQRKGLLLPRITNAALTSNPLDTSTKGMMIFNVDDNNLYIKKQNGVAGWNKVADFSNFGLGNLSDAAYVGIPAANQLLRFSGTKWENWTHNFLTTAQTVTLTGDVTGSALLSGNIPTTLSNTGVTAGIYPKVTVDTKGRVTAGSALAAGDIPAGSGYYIQNQNAVVQTGDYRIGGTGAAANVTITSMTAGSVLFAGTGGAVAQKNAQLFWDNTANELGIGTTNPAARLDVNGSFKLGATGTPLGNIIKTNFSVNVAGGFDYNTAKSITYNFPAGISLSGTESIILNPRADLPVGVGIGWARVTNAATREITINFTNSGAIKTIGTIAFDVTIIQL